MKMVRALVTDRYSPAISRTYSLPLGGLSCNALFERQEPALISGGVTGGHPSSWYGSVDIVNLSAIPLIGQADRWCQKQPILKKRSAMVERPLALQLLAVTT
jgi:hypothetical protein